MKLSWSHKVFLWINKRVGRYPILDMFMVFCAQYLIFIFLGAIGLWLLLNNPEQELYFIFILGTAILFSFIINWSIGAVAQRPRPIREFPGITQLIRPHQTFKSFPSDHTTVSFTFALIVILVGVQALWYWVLLVLASLIAIGRVYVGVHYPRDLIGGVIVAILLSVFSFWLAMHVTIPIFMRLLG